MCSFTAWLKNQSPNYLSSRFNHPSIVSLFSLKFKFFLQYRRDEPHHQTLFCGKGNRNTCSYQSLCLWFYFISSLDIWMNVWFWLEQAGHRKQKGTFFFPRSKCLAPQSRKEILCFPSAFVSMAVALVRQVINKGDFRGKLCLEAEGQEETKSEA